MKKPCVSLNQSSSTARGPVIPPVTDMPTVEPATALISSILASNILGSLQSVMVAIVFFPVTVARMFTAPYFYISGQKPLAAATASPTFPSNSQTVKDTTIFLFIFAKYYNIVYSFTDLSKIKLRNLKSKCV
jgi:hypothetical protein